MIEQPPEGEPDRQPFDVFDPRLHGMTPYPLAAAVDAAEAVLNSLVHFQATLLGCTTPLNLRDEEGQAANAAAQAKAWLETLDAARAVIERDLPLFDSLPEHDPDAADEVKWGGQLLSPAEIVDLNAATPDQPLHRLTTYRQETADVDSLPPVVRKHLTGAKRAATRARNLAAKAEAAAAAEDS
jgi:hypothetical protein